MMDSAYNVEVSEVMTGERYSVPINGLPYDGPFCTNQRSEDGSTIIAENIRDLEELAKNIKNGERLLIYTEK